MRICIISHEYPPRVGGAGGVAFDLANALHRANCDVHVVNGYSSCSSNGGVVTRVPFPSLWPWSYPYYLRKVALAQFDKIVLNDPVAIYAAGACFGQPLYSRSIVIVHGRESYLEGTRRPVFRRIIRFSSGYIKTLMMAKSIVFVSEYIRDAFAEVLSRENPWFRSSVYLDKCIVIPNSVDRNVFYPTDKDRNAWRSKLGFKESDYVVVSASRLVPGKGYQNMLGVIEKCRRVNPRFKWLILGDGPYAKELTALIEKRYMTDAVVMVGRVHRNELRYYYSASDVFLLLSNLDEACPLSYIEASLCGIPCVGRNRAGTVEVLRKLKSATLVENDDMAVTALLRYLNCHEYRSESLVCNPIEQGACLADFIQKGL